MELIQGFVSGRADCIPTDLLPLGEQRALLGAGATRLLWMSPRVLVSGRLWKLGEKDLGRAFIAVCHKPPSAPHLPQGSPALSPTGINGQTGANPNIWGPPSPFSFCSLNHPALVTKQHSQDCTLSQRSTPKYFLWNSLDCKHFGYLLSLFAGGKNFLRAFNMWTRNNSCKEIIQIYIIRVWGNLPLLIGSF